MKTLFVFAVSLGLLAAWASPLSLAAEQSMLVSAEWLAETQLPLRLLDLDSVDDGMFIAAPVALATPFDINTFFDASGRLLAIEQLEHVLGTTGISTSDRVVLYDNANSLNAAFTFWVLDYLGHTDHYVLDGGIDAWLESGGAVSQFSIAAGEEQFKATPDRALLYVTSQVEAAVGYAPVQLIDSRPYSAFCAGHIPSATSYFWGENMAPAGDQIGSRWASRERLAEKFMSLDPRRAVVTYCTSGLAAAHNYFGAKLAGMTNVSVYVDSWTGWTNDGLAADTCASMGYCMIDLELYKYVPGDTLAVKARVTNPGPAQQVDLYILLEVAGVYYFYPTWQTYVNSVSGRLNEGENYFRHFLEFTVPSSIPRDFGPLTFYAVTAYMGTLIQSTHAGSAAFTF